MDTEKLKITDLDKVKYLDKDFFAIYEVNQFRERFLSDPIIEDAKLFLKKEDAEAYVEEIELNVGFQSQIETRGLIKSSLSEEELEKEFKKFEDILIAYDFDEVLDNNIIEYNQGESIWGDIIVGWSWYDYVGYGRSLESLGVAGGEGTYLFSKMDSESDLITDNEESTYKTNYSILLTKDEIREELGGNYTEDELRELIDEKLNKADWLWDNFKNNPESENIRRDIEEVIDNKVGKYSFIEYENGERKDISFHMKKDVSILDIKDDGYTGTLKTNVKYLHCENNELIAIEAPKAKAIYCENNEYLERIDAPNCKELYCENCPELKEENMELSYDCQIEGLEKKNQLKR